MQYTTEEILAQVAAARTKLNQQTNTEAREVTSRENAEILLGAREVYKDKKIKRYKDISRSASEERENLPSAPIGEKTSSSNTSPVGLEEKVVGQEEKVNITPERENLTTRAYTGISAYHVKTDKGTKVNLTIQSAEDAEFGAVVELTAELKHKKRFREIKEYEADAKYFKDSVTAAIEHYRKAPGEHYIGRVHARGRRSDWFADMLVIARMGTNNLEWAQVWLGDDFYDITLDMELNPTQAKYFNSGGLHGNLKSKKKVPTIHTAERKAFNP